MSSRELDRPRSDSHDTNVAVRSHVTFTGPIIILGGSLLGVFVLIGTFIFFAYVTNYWHNFVQETPYLVNGIFLFVAGCLVLVLLGGVGFLIGKARAGNAKIDHTQAETRKIDAETAVIKSQSGLLSAQDGYVVIRQPTGVIEAIPIITQQLRMTAKVDDPTKMLSGSVAQQLPDFVRYSEIRHQIPEGRTFIGISETGVQTRERAVRGLLWVVGGSGTGKSNSVALRVEEDYHYRHRFLGIDPHIFKPDSLYNLMRCYESAFLLPMASEIEDSIAVLDRFLQEFDRRKLSGKWDYPITLVIDEVGALAACRREASATSSAVVDW